MIVPHGTHTAAATMQMILSPFHVSASVCLMLKLSRSYLEQQERGGVTFGGFDTH